MSRYFFHIFENGQSVIDTTGLEIGDDRGSAA